MKIIESFHTDYNGEVEIITENLFKNLFGGSGGKGIFGLISSWISPGDKPEDQYDKDQKEYQKWADEKRDQQKKNLDNEIQHQHDLEKEYKHQQHLAEMGKLKKEEAIKQAQRKRELDSLKLATKQMEEANKKLDMLIKNPMCSELTEESANFWFDNAKRALDEVTPADKKACNNVLDTFSALVYHEDGTFRGGLNMNNINERGEEVFGKDNWSRIKTNPDIVKMKKQITDENGNITQDKFEQALDASMGVTKTKKELENDQEALTELQSQIADANDNITNSSKEVKDYEKQLEETNKLRDSLKNDLGGKDPTEDNIKKTQENLKKVSDELKNGNTSSFNKEISASLKDFSDEDLSKIIKISDDKKSLVINEKCPAYAKMKNLGLDGALKKRLENADPQDYFNNNAEGELSSPKGSACTEFIKGFTLKDDELTDELKQHVESRVNEISDGLEKKAQDLQEHEKKDKEGADAYNNSKVKLEEAKRTKEEGLTFNGEKVTEKEVNTMLEKTKRDLHTIENRDIKSHVQNGNKIAGESREQNDVGEIVKTMSPDEKKAYDNMKSNVEHTDEDGKKYITLDDGSKLYHPNENSASYDDDVKKYETALKRRKMELNPKDPGPKPDTDDAEKLKEWAMKKKQFEVDTQTRNQAMSSMSDEEKELLDDIKLTKDWADNDSHNEKAVDNEKEEGETDSEDSTGEEDDENGDYEDETDKDENGNAKTNDKGEVQKKHIRKNPKVVWKRIKKSNGEGMTKGYYKHGSRKEARISSAEFKQKVESYKKWAASKKQKEEPKEEPKESVQIRRKGLVVEFSSKPTTQKQHNGFIITKLSKK